MPIDAVLKQLNQLRGAQPIAAPVAAAPAVAASAPRIIPPTPSTAPAAIRETPAAPVVPKTAAPTSAAPVAAGNLPELWARLIEAVGKVSAFTRSYLLDAHPVSFEKNVFTIGFDPEFEDKIGLVDNSRNHTLLATKLAELGHANAMIKFVKADAPVGWQRSVATAPSPAPAVAPKPAPAVPATKNAEATPAPAAEKKSAPVPFNKDEFKNDPLIKKALEVFKGTIVEVRA